MVKQFQNIKKFIDSFSMCPFCGQQLQARIVDFSPFSGKDFSILKINSPLKEDLFSFKISYTTTNMHIKTVVIVNIITNEIKYKVNSESYHNRGVLLKQDITEVLELLNPHVELSCINKNCKMEYYICSDTLSFKSINKILEDPKHLFDDDTKLFDAELNAFDSCFEACSVDNYWIQNNLKNKKTYIYATNMNTNCPPIETNQLHFSNSEKFKNKIKTIITFV